MVVYPIFGDIGRVESGFWVILLMRRALSWVQGCLCFGVYIGGAFCPYELDRLADPNRPPPRREFTQYVARIPKSTLVGPNNSHVFEGVS